MTARRNNRSVTDRHSSANSSSISRTFYLPAANVNCSVTAIVEFDKLVARATRTTRAKFTDDD